MDNGLDLKEKAKASEVMGDRDLVEKVLKAMIEKTRADIVLTNVDIEFNRAQSLVEPRLAQIVMAKTGEMKYLVAYLEYLEIVLEKLPPAKASDG